MKQIIILLLIQVFFVTGFAQKMGSKEKHEKSDTSYVGTDDPNDTGFDRTSTGSDAGVIRLTTNDDKP